MDFVLVTASSGKAREASEILGRDVEVAALDLPELQAETAEEIVRAKAAEAYARLRRPCVVEDTSLEFSAWAGLPGPYIKWFERRAGLEALCRSLDGFSDRRARAVSLLALAGNGEPLVVSGVTAGTIAKNPRGRGGFGWDAIFVPDGGEATYAEMSAAEKNAISHRRRAWRELARAMGGSGAGR